MAALEAATQGVILDAVGEKWVCKLAAPTQRQAKDIFWEDMKALTSTWWARPPNGSELTIFLPGAEIMICGLDNPARIEGSPMDRLGVDELANVKQGSWDRHLRPALDTEIPGRRLARAWLFGVPRPGGQFAALAKLAQDPNEPDFEYFTWTSESILSPEAIAAAKRTMDPMVYAQEYLAQRASAEGRAYYGYDVTLNHRDVRYIEGLPLMFCFDFNRSPGIAVVAQEQPLDGIAVDRCPNCPQTNVVSGEHCPRCTRYVPLVTCSCAVGEVFIPRGSNTPMVCTRLANDWRRHKGGVVIYGDATGGAIKSSSVDGSDWDLIRRYLNADFPKAVYDVDDVNPPERARVNAVNLRCVDATGARHLFVNPETAPNLDRDLSEQMVVLGGSGELDKDSDKTLGHAADGWGYAIQKLYPADYGDKTTTEAY